MVTPERITQIMKLHHSSQPLIAESGQCLSSIWLFHNSVLFLALSSLPPKHLDLTEKRPGKCYSLCYIYIFFCSRNVFWAFKYHLDTAGLDKPLLWHTRTIIIFWCLLLVQQWGTGPDRRLAWRGTANLCSYSPKPLPKAPALSKSDQRQGLV